MTFTVTSSNAALFAAGPGLSSLGVLTYTPAVWSKVGGVKLRLEAGPDGMRVVGGQVLWAVPPNFLADEVAVVLRVSDANGQETPIHSGRSASSLV